jgi:hypothetical protein
VRVKYVFSAATIASAEEIQPLFGGGGGLLCKEM